MKGAVFSFDAVDRRIAALRHLKHTKGKWAGRPLEPNAVQVAFIIAPVFGWLRPDDDGNLVRIIRDVYVEMPRKGGKALALDTEILTPGGWSTMGELMPGDHVFGADGRPTRVTHTSEVFTGRDCYRVTTTDGRTVVADAEHLWTVKDRQHKASRGGERWLTLTTQELVDRGVTRGVARPEYRWSLPRQHALVTGEASLPVDPYRLGVWLGDGTTASGAISVGFDDIDAMSELLGGEVSARRHRTCWTVTVPGLRTSLRVAGLLGNKHIPSEYMTASFEQRLALLQGLMDTDGTIDADRGKASFSGVNEDLVRSVATLARTLGFRSTVSSGPAVIDGRQVGTHYRACFHVAEGDPPVFRLTRKMERCGRPSMKGNRFVVSIKSIEPVDSVPTRCIKVDREDGLFLAGRELMVTHNTSLVSGLAMIMGFADGEAGSEVLLGAASKDQAGAAFFPLAQVARGSKVLADAGVRALQGKIVRDADGSVVKAVSSRGDLAHGANVHCGLIDELHVHKSPDLLEAIESGTGARSQPLVFIITTADDGQTTSVYAQRRDMVEKVAKRTIKAPAMYGVVFAADDDDDPFAESTWIKANPLYPVTPSKSSLESAAAKAQSSSAGKASFMRLHCGIRARLDAAFIDLAKWDANRGIVDEKELAGRRAIGGLDLASVSDVTALAWLFPDDSGGYDALWRFWIPEASLDALDGRTARTASSWVADGWLTLTPGDVTDYNFIRTQINTDMDVFDVEGLGADPWNATQLLNDLQEDGAPVETVRQGVQSLSAPMKELDRLIRAGTSRRPLFRHGGNPVARWMADNLRAQVDSNGNVKPDKAKSMDKIDGMSAAITALHVVLASEQARSAYDNHDDLIVF
ncbi:terminase TerL endonuclease subunit [Naumannella halotolerans]|uniref:terminase TerL endonuclease subunit n=1 Tax=Naumannella halotolerans TaxID=993414 RepID=UPI001414E497|nr:terminase TerL endonuclease subunit [Naumannella halotolerans]